MQPTATPARDGRTRRVRPGDVATPTGAPVEEQATGRDRGARLHARLSVRQKEILERAAAIEGRTLTDFVLTHAQEAAQQTIREHTVLSLSTRDTAVFVNALLEPWTPPDGLRAEIDEMRALFDGR